ncbi:4-alpha-glucanotransferase [Actinospica sp.]|jgi:4-alpha-glucanotransferase|uniref:4-alpha-glucanotransferase n=1 Tax=Actinospica sp. TaxID=1872142 RepID=UPI002CE4964F|nr:4-alpha-glucanotransferase [Actinospica sp.]HWG25199.1 4-alpha-glucanotransferase [Actinospica sp.]
MSPGPDLLALARAYGVATEYHDWQGRRVEVSTATLIAVLAAFGVPASTTALCRKALRNRRVRRPLPTCIVLRAEPGGGTGRGDEVTVHAPVDTAPRLWIELENGGRRYDVSQVRSRVGEVDGFAEYDYAIPAGLPLGWHTLSGHIGGESRSCPLAVAPNRLETASAEGRGRAWGFTLQLHAVRSQQSWGMGDLADLTQLALLAGNDLGAGFLVINPLHASSGVKPIDPSPYLPASRRYVDPAHLRIESTYEYAYAPPSIRQQVDSLGDDLRKAGPAGDLIDRDAVWDAKISALRLLYELPIAERGPGRDADFRAFLRREAEPLRTHATWMTIVERHGRDESNWPKGLRNPQSARTRSWQKAEAAEIDFHCWLQWLLDEQLATAKTACRRAGMPYGIIHDLAIGAQSDGADVWADSEVYAHGVMVGAPPDEFNTSGQNWGSRPWRPDKLAETGYSSYRRILQGTLRHAHGLRIDHVMGLFRLWWIPEGATADQGTYVSYDHEAMLGVLTLEAHRSGALLIGEDLGTVEPWVRTSLASRGILGTSVLWFERDANGNPLHAARWRTESLATVTTHDLPPTAAVLAGESLDASDWLAALRREGLLRRGAGEPETVDALHRYLAWTPARLVGVYLPDAVGDRRPHNLPGTDAETYPNWRYPLADGRGSPVLLEDLARNPRVRSLARALRILG